MLFALSVKYQLHESNLLQTCKAVARCSMKSNAFILVGLLFAGCATPPKVVESVGPDPATAISSTTGAGSLMVFSAYEVNADFNSRDAHRPEYTNYRILTADGEPLQMVHNNCGTMLQRPMAVDLPAGTYQVVARANGYGLVTVPVTIAPGETTMVHLQGGVAWPGHPAFDASNSVRLPDGQVVGWKSVIAMK